MYVLQITCLQADAAARVEIYSEHSLGYMVKECDVSLPCAVEECDVAVIQDGLLAGTRCLEKNYKDDRFPCSVLACVSATCC